MKAVVIERPHEVAFREVETPVVGPDDVLVRSHKAGVCRTDLEVLAGELDPGWVRYPCIPGHEWAGSIAAVGENVADLAAGDRVVCEGMIPCHRCRACRIGRTNVCESNDHLGFTRAGGYGELVVAPRRVVHRLPDTVSYDAAVLIEPGSVVLRGLERAQPRAADAVGVVGVGTLGSLAISLAKAFAPSAIVAFGIRDEELSLARRLGATDVVNVAAEERYVGELDLVVETAGAVPAVELATRLPRPGGRVVLLGIAVIGLTLELPSDRFVLGDFDVVGFYCYTSACRTRMGALAGIGSVYQ